MLLILQLIGLSGVVLGQFYGEHPMSASPGGRSPFSSDSGDSETLPISQEELAQLMAQSLASSSGGGYGRHNQNEGNDDFGANFDGEDGAEEEHPAPHQPEEQEGQFGQQDNNEGSHYQQPEGQEGPEEQHEPQQPNSGGYENSAPGYQQEGEQYQSGQYPDSHSSSYGEENEGRHQEPQPGAYGGNRNIQYKHNSDAESYAPQRGRQRGHQTEAGNKEYADAVGSMNPHYQDNQGSSYSGLGSGYSHPGSESYRSYDFRSSPRSKSYRN